MSKTTTQGSSHRAWNTPWNIRKSEHARSKPEGGFVFIPAMALLGAWWAYKRGIIGLADLRVWFACHELVAWRCGIRGNRRPRFVEHELVELIGGCEKQVRTSLRRLQHGGLVRWSQTAVRIDYGTERLSSGELADLDRLAVALVNRRRKVPVPRRTVRMLCRMTRPVLIATVLGHLLRCMYYRNGECCPDGRCKSSWIADVFGVDYRNVKAARGELVEMDLLIVEPTDQRSMNRWGPRVRVNLEWQLPALIDRHGSPPRTDAKATRSPPPRDNRKLLIGSVNQKPAPRRPSGFLRGEGRKDPRLRNVQMEDLRDPRKTEALWKQAVSRGLITQSEADRLRFFGAAEHARSVGTQNPCGLFFATVRDRNWRMITLREEDQARSKLAWLKEHSRDLSSRVSEPRASSASRTALLVTDEVTNLESVRQIIRKSLGLDGAQDHSGFQPLNSGRFDSRSLPAARGSPSMSESFEGGSP